jgi:hypothetical protein
MNIPSTLSLSTALAWLPNEFSSALDAVQKPYYCGNRYSHVRAVLPRRLCLGLATARSARASAASHPESISACRNDDSVTANSSDIKATD